MTKVEQMQNLWSDLAKINTEDIYVKRKGKKTNVGLVNQFTLHDFIPNKWFDWKSRVHSKIVIIGQDWGPYKVLKTYIDEYEIKKDLEGFDYEKFLFSRFSSRTENFIIKALTKTYLEKFGKEINEKIWNDMLFTVAVMFTRQGKHFRGNANFDENESLKLSIPFLKRQLEIVEPKIIMPLGKLALKAVNEIYNLNLVVDKLSTVINSNPIIKLNKCTIIPNYHPACHVAPQIQMSIWKTLWNEYDTY